MFLVIAHSPGRPRFPPPRSSSSSTASRNQPPSSGSGAEPLTASSFGAFNEFDAAAMAAGGGDESPRGREGRRPQPWAPRHFPGQFGSVRFSTMSWGTRLSPRSTRSVGYLGSFSPRIPRRVSRSRGRDEPVGGSRVRESLARAGAVAQRGGCVRAGLLLHRGGSRRVAREPPQGRQEKGLVGVLKEGVVRGPGTTVNRLKAADLVGSARVCATHSARDIIHCLGGVRALPALRRSTRTVDDAAAELRDAIDLLAAMLEGSRLSREALQVSGVSRSSRTCSAATGAATLRRGAAVDGAAGEERGRHAWQGPGGDTEQAAVRLLLDLRM